MGLRIVYMHCHVPEGLSNKLIQRLALPDKCTLARQQILAKAAAHANDTGCNAYQTLSPALLEPSTPNTPLLHIDSAHAWFREVESGYDGFGRPEIL